MPVNGLSFGQVSTLILRTIYDRVKAGAEYDVRLFAIASQVDLSTQPKDAEFEAWIQKCIKDAFYKHDRNNPIFKLWHLSGSLFSASKEQTLLSFYELDAPTPIELNIARNNKTLFTCDYTTGIFKSCGVDTRKIPLAFDSYNFRRLNKQYFQDGRVVFNVCGKLEKRKHHVKIIKSWMKKYGNNPNFALQCAIYNPFLNPQQNNQIIAQHILEGKAKPFNVNFLPSMADNASYNDFLNSGDIVLGMSGAEGWGLPEFQSVAIGKHAVILNASAYKEWATEENSILVSPNGKEDAADGVFFQKGGDLNQGQIFTWDEEAFLAACDKAISRSQSNRLNEAGLKLQQDFTKDAFVDKIIELAF